MHYTKCSIKNLGTHYTYGINKSVVTDSFKLYQYVRESNCLTNFLDHVCFATKNLVGDMNQFLAKNHQTSAGRKAPNINHLQRGSSLQRKPLNLRRRKSPNPTMCWLQLVRAFMSLLNSVKALGVGR